MICGIGINDVKYKVTMIMDNGERWTCPFYSTWKSMISRCYNETNLKKRSTYRGVTVCKSWHKLSNFRRWMKKQDWKNKAIDKDIMFPNNKQYSPSKCIFVTSELNNLFTGSDAIRGKYPQGVNWNKQRQRFEARIREDGVKRALGRYKNTEEASRAYKIAKIKRIETFTGKDDRLDMGLKRHIKAIKLSI